MLFRYIESFREGDAVPDWLIAAEPREPGATPPKVTFDQDVHVVETSAGYWIMNDRLLGPTKTLVHVDGEGCGRNALMAAGRPVVLVARMNVLNEERGTEQ